MIRTEPEPKERLREIIPMPKLDNQTILLAFACVTGLAVLLQAIILLAIFVSLRKAAGSIRDEVEKLRSSIMPVIFDTRDILANAQGVIANAQEFLTNAHGFFTRVAPKVEVAATDLLEVSQVLRAQSVEVQSSILEVLERVRRQSDRLDGMISNLLDTVDRAGGFVANVVSKPVRQISLLLNVVKAVVESLRGSGAQLR